MHRLGVEAQKKDRERQRDVGTYLVDGKKAIKR